MDTLFGLLFALAVVFVAAQIFTSALECTGARMGVSEGVTGSIFAAVGTACRRPLFPLFPLFPLSRLSRLSQAARTLIAVMLALIGSGWIWFLRQVGRLTPFFLTAGIGFYGIFVLYVVVG